jgi:two-component system, LytTR family, response regulator
MSIRALVVDDESLARQSVRRFLRHHADIAVVGELGDGQSAIDAIRTQRPDLIFLDIQMPELDGFEVVTRVGVNQMPATVFVTAYDQYALRAFDANAVDYLLKPFGKTRFDLTLSRVRERIATRLDTEAAQRLLRVMESVAERGRYIDRLPVSESGRILFVKTREIQWIEAAGNYARLHVAARSHDVRETLTSLEGKLDPASFLRIHRSAIVNVQFVREVHPWFHGYHLVVLENGLKLRMSRYQREVAARLGLAQPRPAEN